MQYDAYRELTSNIKQIRNCLGHGCVTTGEKHPAGTIAASGTKGNQFPTEIADKIKNQKNKKPSAFGFEKS